VYFSSRSIILKNRDYQEADRFVTLFTERQGKFTAVARGVKKPKSSLRACTQPFCFSQLYFFQGKSDLALVTQGKPLEFFAAAREQFAETLSMLYLMDLLDQVLPERDPQPELFRVSLQVMQTLELSGRQPWLPRFFELRLLQELGYAPVLEQCARCGRPGRGSVFSLADGGLVCPECASGCGDFYPLSREALAALSFLSRAPLAAAAKVKISAAAWAQLEQLFLRALEYHFERSFKTLRAISGLQARGV
jgi:DNA repair protein RecO (recombination protein O)